MELNKYLDYLVEFIKEEVKNANAKGVVIGVSGGIDSAVVSLLAKKAFPNDYLTVWMPIDSSKQDYECVEELINDNKLNNISVELKETFENIKKALPDNCSKLALANTKARLRMTTLYAIAQSNNYLVVGTDNLIEWHIGYFTKFGDGGVDIVPIIKLLKSEVKEAGKILGVPKSIIDRAPTASLWENQTDESEIGFSYDEIDEYLQSGKASNELKNRIDYLNKISEHKRNGAKQPLKFKRK